jgi:isoleucyl-tRNA synthetase
MRKEAGFDVVNHVNVYYYSEDILANAINENLGTISKEVLADKIERKQSEFFDSCYVKRWNINGEDITIAVEKIAKL